MLALERGVALRTELSYNAGMGLPENSALRSQRNLQIDGWLSRGGLVLTSSERARRFLLSNYHRTRRAEGLAAWPSPAIFDWQTFLRTSWETQANSAGDEDRLILDSTQERSIWAEIAGLESRFATTLSRPRNRIASLAQRAHQLICSYAPGYLRMAARSGWQQDAETFSRWLVQFEQRCASNQLLSSARLPVELISRLEREPSGGQPPRSPLLLVGFDRILPSQKQLLNAWGQWQIAPEGDRARNIRFYRAPDERAELSACVQWCKNKLEEDTQARLLVVTDSVAQKRGEIERAFLDLDRSGRSFEFSLGIPLSKTALGRSALMLLRWLSGGISESEVDWLLSSGFSVADAAEANLLQAYMRGLRRSGLESPHWSLQSFLSQALRATLPSGWVKRMNEAQRRLNDQTRSLKSPLEWSEIVPHLLQTIGWPGQRPLSSEEFQVVRRWEAALESCAAVGFDGRRITWTDFLQVLTDAAEETLFAPETRDAPIQITGVAESAGLSADAIWFMGATEDAWPASGATHPFLPIEVQRDAAMPHASAQIDWDLADSMTSRLLSSAAEICFSYARQGEDADARPSRLTITAAGAPNDLPPDLLAPEFPPAATVQFEDATRVAFREPHVEGGSSVLTYQSQCGFKAFAAARLGARGWNAAEPCLTPAQRGRLLHAVLHSIWGGPKTGGIRELSELRSIESREQFIAAHVSRAMQKELKRAVRERLPERYLELEERRLCSLVGEWLEYELTRVDFKVVKTEDEQTVEIGGITFDVRLDRVDRLSDESLLVIDYKTGAVKKKSWDLPRPADVQLPLYASYGFEKNEAVGGLVFAKVLRGDDLGFEGCLKDARATLDPTLKGSNGLVKSRLDDSMIQDWKQYIDKLATDFLLGRADADPREYPDTCERCDFQAICRIQEHRELTSENDEPGEESADE